MEKAMTSAKIEVKKLEWRRTDYDRFGAYTIAGLYEVLLETVGAFEGRWVVGLGGSIIADEANEQAAMDAAQANFERRILSAIVAGK